MIKSTGIYNTNTINYNKSSYTEQSRSSNLSFGHDKEANDRLKKEVKGLEPEQKKTILDLQRDCNLLEDKIRIKELSSNDDGYDFDLRMLFEVKSTLSRLVLDFLPSSNFTENEAQALEDEAEKIEYEIENSAIQSLEEEPDDNKKTLKMDSNVFRNPGWRRNLAAILYSNMNPDEDDATDDKIRNCTNLNDTTSSMQDEKMTIEEIKPPLFKTKGFDDVSGLDDVKKSFKKHIIDPLNNPDAVNKREKLYGITRPNGYLLYGPPGCGKTMIVEALASESKLPLFKLDIAKTGSPFIHQTAINFDKFIEKMETFIQETNKPAILFIDEYDSFASSRDTLQHSNYKLEETDKLLDILNEASKKNIIVIAATNNLEMVDNAAKRTGRFDKKFKVGLPDQKARKQYLIQNLKDREMAQDFVSNEKDMNKAVKLTEGYTFSDLNAICKETSDRADDNDSKITIEDFEYIIKHTDIQKLDPFYLSKFGIIEETTKTKDIMFG